MEEIKGKYKIHFGVLKSKITPSKFPKDILSDFAVWCQERGVDVFKEDLKGEKFKLFLAERERNYNRSLELLQGLILLIKTTVPDDGNGQFESGFNEVIEEAITTRVMPTRRKHSRYPESCAGVVDGENAAVDILEKEYFHLFQ